MKYDFRLLEIVQPDSECNMCGKLIEKWTRCFNLNPCSDDDEQLLREKSDNNATKNDTETQSQKSKQGSPDFRLQHQQIIESPLPAINVRTLHLLYVSFLVLDFTR